MLVKNTMQKNKDLIFVFLTNYIKLEDYNIYLTILLFESILKDRKRRDRGRSLSPKIKPKGAVSYEYSKKFFR